jgi:hypothetical protein
MNKNYLKDQIRIQKLSSSTRSNMSYPSIPQMAKNLGRDIVKNVQSVAAGNPLNVEQTEAEKRKSICHGCEFFNKQSERCLKCGCFMAVKVYLKASNCPIGKW